MTKEYNTLRDIINKILPDRLDLEFGCEIIVAGISKDNPGCERDVVLYGTQEQRNKGMIPTEYYGEVPKTEIEKILGKPLSITDVLRALDEKNLSTAIDAQGYIWDNSGKLSQKIYLDYPLSHEVNNEACRSLIELLQDNQTKQ